MLPSRASVPSPGIEKKEPELATPTKPSVPMSPSVKHHPGLTIPSPEKNNNNDGTPRKKFKYVKPRLGGNFQAKIGAFVPKTKNDSDELNVSMSSASLPPASSSSTGTGIKKKRMGRPPKGGKSKQQQGEFGIKELTRTRDNSPESKVVYKHWANEDILRRLSFTLRIYQGQKYCNLILSVKNALSKP